jgi:hypothetical protein
VVDVRDYLKKAGGNWWRADDLMVGDRLVLIDAGYVDEKTFDRAYLVMTARLARTGEEKNLRLGPKNTKRLTDGFGTHDTSKWVNQVAEVISIETYSGVGQKGFLLRGLPTQPNEEKLLKQPAQPGEPSPDAVKLIRDSQDIIEMGVPMNEKDWNAFVPAKLRAELLKLKLVEKKEDLYFFTEVAKTYLK